ncbi:hypothetical protein HD554DRAFT_2038963 [Boletus coccyginus]|nr:hypothetical protein HD554DRAFT_2038963 [Boletus coccyginus]
MPKVKPFPPFYNESSAPPAFPSLLTNQLELFSNTHHSPSLLADEILPPKSKSVMQIQSALPERPALPKMLPSKQDHAAQSPYSTTKREHQHSQAYARSHSHADLESLSEDSSSSSSLSDSPSDKGLKILKPPGEPGCPGRGRYNLEGSFTHQLIDEHLDMTKCASAQNLGTSEVQYTSSHARRHELEFAAGKAKLGPLLLQNDCHMFSGSGKMLWYKHLKRLEKRRCLVGIMGHTGAYKTQSGNETRKFSWEWGNLVLDVQLSLLQICTESLLSNAALARNVHKIAAVVRWHITGSNAGVNSPICTYIRSEKSEEEGNEKIQVAGITLEIHAIVEVTWHKFIPFEKLILAVPLVIHATQHSSQSGEYVLMETSLPRMFTMNCGSTLTLITTTSPRKLFSVPPNRRLGGRQQCRLKNIQKQVAASYFKRGSQRKGSVMQPGRYHCNVLTSSPGMVFATLSSKDDTKGIWHNLECSCRLPTSLTKVGLAWRHCHHESLTLNWRQHSPHYLLNKSMVLMIQFQHPDKEEKAKPFPLDGQQGHPTTSRKYGWSSFFECGIIITITEFNNVHLTTSQVTWDLRHECCALVTNSSLMSNFSHLVMVIPIIDPIIDRTITDYHYLFNKSTDRAAFLTNIVSSVTTSQKACNGSPEQAVASLPLAGLVPSRICDSNQLIVNKRTETPGDPATDKCRHEEVNYSYSLRRELYEKDKLLSRFKTRLRQQGQTIQQEREAVEQHYSKLCDEAIGNAQKEFEKHMKDLLHELGGRNRDTSVSNLRHHKAEMDALRQQLESDMCAQMDAFMHQTMNFAKCFATVRTQDASEEC